MRAIELVWPGGEHTFDLRIGELQALQDACDAGPEFILNRIMAGQWRYADLFDTIRLGLIGGGMNPQRAQELVTTYAVNAPLDQTFPLALDIITARWSGVSEIAA